MATVGVEDGLGLSMPGLRGKLLGAGRLVSRSESEIVLQSGKLIITWSGTGLTVDPDMTAVAGTIDSISAQIQGKAKKGVAPDPVDFFELGELAFPGDQLPVLGRAKDQLALLRAIFSGDDEIAGGDQRDDLAGFDGDDTLDGAAGTDTLAGGEGDDILDGGLGGDRMAGGLGDDTYMVDDRGDRVTEIPDGIDTVVASITYRLPKLVENLTLAGDDAIDASGNELDNTLIANDGPNRLHGLDGDDILDGAVGADHLWGGEGADTFIGGHLDRIFDFTTADDDVIDLTLLVPDLDVGRPGDFIALTVVEGNVRIGIDLDGAGADYTDAAIIVEGDLGTDLDGLLADGRIVTV